MSSSPGCPQVTWIPPPAPNSSVDSGHSLWSSWQGVAMVLSLKYTSLIVTALCHKLESSIFYLPNPFSSCENQHRHHLLQEVLRD